MQHPANSSTVGKQSIIMRELLLFQAGDGKLALDLPLVKGIDRLNPRYVEQAGGSKRLMQIVDGIEIPLYDLSTMFDPVKASDDPNGQKAILVDIPDHSLALGVDRVERVISVDSNRIEPLPPIFKGQPLSCFPLVLKHEGALILLVNPARMESVENEIMSTKAYSTKPDAIKASFEENELPESMDEPQAATRTAETSRDGYNQFNDRVDVSTTTKANPEVICSVELEKEIQESEHNSSEISDNNSAVEEDVSTDLIGIKQTARQEAPQAELLKGNGSLFSDARDRIKTRIRPKNISHIAMASSREKETVGVTGANIRLQKTPAEKKTKEPDIENPCQEKSQLDADAQNTETPLSAVAPIEKETKIPETENPNRKKPQLDAVAKDIETTSTAIAPIREIDGSRKESYFLRSSGEKSGTDRDSGSNSEMKKSIAVKKQSQAKTAQLNHNAHSKGSKVMADISGTKSAKPMRPADKDTSALLFPTGDEAAFLIPEATGPELTPTNFRENTLSNASEIEETIVSGRPQERLASPEKPQDQKIDTGTRKRLHRGPVAVSALSLLVLLVIIGRLWPKSEEQLPEIIKKSVVANFIDSSLKQTPGDLSQTPHSVNTNDLNLTHAVETKNSWNTPATAGDATLRQTNKEVIRVDTQSFTFTVERPLKTTQKDRPAIPIRGPQKHTHSHIVIKGDTLWQIAKQYLGDPFRYPELAELSRITDPDLIHPGDVVKIFNKMQPISRKDTMPPRIGKSDKPFINNGIRRKAN